MPHREYFTVDRSPQEVRDLLDWATIECNGKLEHENPYAMGVAACLMYLMGETQQRPQDYKGVFTLKNVLRQSENTEKIGSVRDASLNQLADQHADALIPGNPKTLFYGAPFLGGDVAPCEGFVNNGDNAFGRDADNGGCKG